MTSYEERLKEDNVNHPSHYTQGNIECIEAIKAALTPEEFRAHCDLNEYELWERALNELKTLRGKYTSDKHTVYRS